MCRDEDLTGAHERDGWVEERFSTPAPTFPRCPPPSRSSPSADQFGELPVDRLDACTPDGLENVLPYAFEMAEHLVTGDRLPSLRGTNLEGSEVDITASVAGRWAVVLFYRGDW